MKLMPGGDLEHKYNKIKNKIPENLHVYIPL